MVYEVPNRISEIADGRRLSFTTRNSGLVILSQDAEVYESKDPDCDTRRILESAAIVAGFATKSLHPFARDDRNHD
jgi:hypothetical protein